MRVVLADDHRIVREGLRWMLADEPDIDIVGEADSGAALLALLEHTSTDVVLLDVRMPDLNGLEALELLRRRPDTPRVIVLSMYREPAYVRRAVELGAAGYLLKSTSRPELVLALKMVAEGRGYVQGEVTAPLLAQVAGDHGDTAAVPQLSGREREVLELIARGQGNRQIARSLRISEATVKTHLKGIFAHLDVTTRAEAVAVGLREGLIE
jgi:DNA-binding NarL/FixJ family response regulator